jgi:hypothetical protein
VNIGNAILEAVARERKNLENAIRRRKRAGDLMQKADRDIAAIGGALMALESLYRSIYKGEEIETGGAAEQAAPPNTYKTLAGETPLNSDG